MAEVRISHSARIDLSDIRAYSLAQFDAATADGYFLGFDALFDILAEHPFAGMERPDLGVGIRGLTHRRHRIFYHVIDNAVIVLRIIHHARNARHELARGSI